MKYYAVRKGLTPGIYTNWNEAEANVKGYPGAQFKSFKSEALALEYLNGNEPDDNNTIIETNLPDIYAFCDGSFNAKTNTYGFGGFLAINDEQIVMQGTGHQEDMIEMRNVAGEILGAQIIIQKALESNLPEITLYYDYTGIEKWATGEWKANKPATRDYKAFMQRAMKSINIKFVHVKGHSGVEGNERADKLAKEAVGLL